MKPLFFCAGIALVLTSCSKNRISPKELGLNMLNDARREVTAGNYEAAKDSIYKLREVYPQAIEAREQGILLLDSIEIIVAHDSLEHLKQLYASEKRELNVLEGRKNGQGVHGQEYYDQRTRTFQLQNEIDRLAAKERFFKKKLQIDTQAEADSYNHDLAVK